MGISVIMEEPDDTDEIIFQSIVNIETKPEIKPEIKPKKVIPLNQKDLEQKFLEVFELVNDDCIYIEPKFIPIIPGDDPAILNKASDDYF